MPTPKKFQGQFLVSLCHRIDFDFVESKIPHLPDLRGHRIAERSGRFVIAASHFRFYFIARIGSGHTFVAPLSVDQFPSSPDCGIDNFLVFGASCMGRCRRITVISPYKVCNRLVLAICTASIPRDFLGQRFHALSDRTLHQLFHFWRFPVAFDAISVQFRFLRNAKPPQGAFEFDDRVAEGAERGFYVAEEFVDALGVLASGHSGIAAGDAFYKDVSHPLGRTKDASYYTISSDVVTDP